MLIYFCFSVNLKRLLSNSLNKVQDQEEYKGFFELYKNKFINLIYLTDDEQNIPLLLEFIKMYAWNIVHFFLAEPPMVIICQFLRNKEQIIKKKRQIYTVSIFKLLYTLKLTDKSLEIYKSEVKWSIF
jgi:hypothetical protein